ncbi:MAG TPA: thiamine pyrophosphate-dependent enzyme [Chthonomonadales bacterium]|nr:thiamine pyrophosphate-dependent enzyme [Chthonomonadales bacterium]
MGSVVDEATSTLQAVRLLELMETAREGDRREGILLRQGKGWFSVSGMGHEALAPLALLLRPDDWLFPHYRDRAICLARGLSTRDMALAFFARETSTSGGRQMPGHFSARRLNIFSTATPTAMHCLPACGAAWAMKMEGRDTVALCCVGEASIRQGDYYEAVAFAVQERLPVILVVEDNQYGISTPTLEMNPYRIGVFHPDTYVFVNGRDPVAVHDAGAAAIARARRGEGPSVLWCEVDRLAPHTSADDHRVYRDPAEIEAMMARDPLSRLRERLIAEGVIDAAAWEEKREAIAASVEADYAAAERAREAPAESVTLHTLGDEPPPSAPPVELPNPSTMVSAINHTLDAALAANPKLLVFGEDVADPKGGVFGLTKGLGVRHPGRVVNSPLAESTIVGVAVGLAAAGWTPAFEIQFIDFITPATNQLVNQAATLRWRTVGEWTCPLVIISPCGAYLPGGGPWHSQTNEAVFAHHPGLRVVEPSNPEDAACLLWSALQGQDPTLYLVPKHIFRKRMPVPDRLHPAPIGRAAVRRSGSDVTLVTWGNGVEMAEEAAERAAGEGVGVEIVDLRTIAPCDWTAIEQSVARTGRLVVLHEDARTGGFGQAVVAEMTAYPDRWNHFLAAPQIVARADCHVPFCPSLEYASLPDIACLMKAIRLTMA